MEAREPVYSTILFTLGLNTLVSTCKAYSNAAYKLKVCSGMLRYVAFAFASTSPSKFNIASMEMQTHMHRMGLNPFLTFYIDVDANANANVKCEHTLIVV